jgi:PAS domain S-box-containing protein
VNIVTKMTAPLAEHLVFLDAVAAPLLLVQADRILHANAAAAHLLRSPPDTLRGRQVADFAVLEADLQPETFWQAADGTLLRLGVNIAPLGEALLYTLHDRSAEKDATLMRRILNTLSDPIYAKDRQHRFLYANQAFLDGVKIPSFEQIRGRTDVELWGAISRELFEKTEADLMISDSEQVDFVYTTTRLPGEQRTFLVSKHVLHNDSGEITGLAAINRDITTLREQEDLLSQREIQFREAQELAKLGTFVLDANTLEEWWSDSLYNIYGVPVGTPTSRDLFSSLLHPDDYAPLQKKMRQIMVQGEIAHFSEHRIIQPSGEIRFVKTVVEVHRNPEGKAEKIIGVVHDVTEEYHAAELLRASEENARHFRDHLKKLYLLNLELVEMNDMDMLTRRIVEGGRDLMHVDRIALIVSDPETGEYVGTFGTNMQGETTDERAWRSWPALLDMELRAQAEHGLVYREGVDLHYENKLVGRGWHVTSFLHYNSQFVGTMVMDNAISGRPLQPEYRELFALYSALLGSLLARKRAIDALQRSEERYRLLAQNASDVIWAMDLTGRFTYVSPSVEKLRGYTPEEVIAAPLEHALTPDSFEIASRILAENMSRALGGERIPNIVMELEQPRKDGTTVWTEATAAALLNDRGEMIGILGVTRDITERRLIQANRIESERLQIEIHKEQELNKLKTAMMLRISHEFRTPLAVILSSVDIMENYADRISAERRMSHMNNIRKQISHLSGIIDAIHLSVKGIFDHLEFHSQAFDLPALCREVIVEQESRYHRTSQIDFHIQSVEKPFRGDENLVRLVLQNLLSNALKFSRKDKPVLLLLNITPEAASIEIHDQGMGIPVAEIERVFEPFYRVSEIGEIPGLGIGLSIVRDVVAAHRGSIRLEPNPAGGTIAYLHLPSTN